MKSLERLQPKRLSFAVALVAVAALLAAASAGSAILSIAPDVGAAVTLGPVNVANGLVTLSGNVGGTPTAGVNLTVNGQPVGLDPTGQFNASVNLNGASQIQLVLKNPANGQQSLLSIPISLGGPAGTIPGNVLDPLKNAGITIDIPPGGFAVSPGGTLTVDGKVLNPDSLLSLSINGQAVIPGPGGTITTTVPPGGREVVVVATGSNGVSETTSFPITLSSSINSTAATSVAASSAIGLRIVRVRYLTNETTKTKRLTMVVTVKDKRGLLVRGATVRASAVANGYRFAGRLGASTNSVGKATLMLIPENPAFGNRLATRVTARTPAAKAERVTSVRLPVVHR